MKYNKPPKPICSFNDCSTISDSKGVCRHHYHIIYKSNTNCKSCGSLFKTGSFTGICSRCKSAPMGHNNLLNKRLYSKIDESVLDETKWLLLRYKWDTFSSVDIYRATNLYQELFGDDKTLDNLLPLDQLKHIMNDLMVMYKKNRP